ncbi:MAG: hypothetical protein MHPDNHAH_01308 [Anaerolineales bacterium]|nr:hypothetical protein [Anaerolineales bacterium]
MTKDEVKQKNLLSAIDFEIKNIDDEVSRAGWNFWILLGSIGTLGWFLLEELGGGAHDWKHSLLVFLMLNLALEVISNLKSLTYPIIRSQSVNRFFIASRVFGSSRLAYIFVLFRNFALISIIHYVKDSLIWHQALIAYYVVFFILTLFILFTSFIDLPLKPSKSTFTKFIGGGIAIVINFVVLGSLTTEVFTGKLFIEINEYKIGALIFSISFLAPYIIVLNQNTYQKTSLVNVRRDLLLGNLSIDDAKKQTEILLLGMQVDDYLQDDVKVILELLNQSNSYASKVNKQFEKLNIILKRKMIAKMKVHELTNALNAVENALVDTHKDSEALTKSSQLLDKQILIFQKKSFLLERVSASQDAFFEKIINAYKTSSEKIMEANQRHSNTIEIVNSIKDRIEFLRARTRKHKS